MSEQLSAEEREALRLLCNCINVNRPHGPLCPAGVAARLLTARAELSARLEAVEAVLKRMERRGVDHRHENETGYWGVEGRAYYYAGDVIDDIYDLRAALHPDPSEAGA